MTHLENLKCAQYVKYRHTRFELACAIPVDTDLVFQENTRRFNMNIADVELSEYVPQTMQRPCIALLCQTSQIRTQIVFKKVDHRRATFGHLENCIR